jgi:hypothetical protein
MTTGQITNCSNPRLVKLGSLVKLPSGQIRSAQFRDLMIFSKWSNPRLVKFDYWSKSKLVKLQTGQIW